jgi:FkbM family methyltransferase
MAAGKVFEPEIVEIARRYIRPHSAVLDVGANLGQMAILFSQAAEDVTVYAIEAQRPVYDFLAKNIEANQASVKPIFAAAYNKSGETFHFPPPDFVRFAAYGSYNLPLDATEGDPVESVRIDDLSIERPVSFMKVDVQGCDLFAMQGATETIRRHRMPILFEFEQQFQAEYGTCFQDYVNFVDSIGYVFAETVLNNNYLAVPRP